MSLTTHSPRIAAPPHVGPATRHRCAAVSPRRASSPPHAACQPGTRRHRDTKDASGAGAADGDGDAAEAKCSAPAAAAAPASPPIGALQERPWDALTRCSIGGIGGVSWRRRGTEVGRDRAGDLCTSVHIGGYCG
eukprot:352803-Chlamydomonas_euryale.AAC.10